MNRAEKRPPGSVRLGAPAADVWAAAEAIASRDHNNLYLTSCFFADREKYRAFCAFYAVMRVVDDRIDELPTRRALSDAQRKSEHRVVSAWHEGVDACYLTDSVPLSVVEACSQSEAHLLFNAFARSLEAFPAPQVLWRNFFRSMHWDLDHERFETWQEFLTYAEGASVAPTTIYLFLIASGDPEGTGFDLTDFNLLECGRKLGIFAYIGHVVRDIEEDLRTGDDGLLYLCREDMSAYGVTEELLFADLEQGRASEPTRRLVAELLGRARLFLSEGRSSMAALSGHLDKDCEFILELIVTMYERVIDKIESSACDPMGQGHRLTPEEKRVIMNEVAHRTGFSPMRQDQGPSGS